MSSFIDKFFGFVKNIVAGKKKESQEPEVIHESELPQEPEIIPEPEHVPEELETQESKLNEPEPEEPESQESELNEAKPEEEAEPELEELETQESELNEAEPEEEAEPELEELETQELELNEAKPEEPESQESELNEAKPEEPESQESELNEAEPDEEAEPEPEEPESSIETLTSEPERKDEYDYTYISQKIRNIITQHYSYSGFSINDSSGYSRFRTYARDYEIDLPESDSELRRLIVSSGTLIEGNVYVFNYEDVQRMLCEVQRLIDNGADVIYFRDLESFIEESNLYSELSNRIAVHEILRDNYEGYIFTGLFMENSSGQKRFRSYMDGLRYILAKYFPDGFNYDYALLRKYALKENIILSGNDKALKRETEALKEWLYDE